MINTEEYPNYQLIAAYKSIDFSYGKCDNGWVISNYGKTDLIPFQEYNFVSFLRLFELETSAIYKENQFIKPGLTLGEIDQYLPITNVLHQAIGTQSVYWTNLLVNFILESKIQITYFSKQFGIEHKEEWMTQALAHKIKKCNFRSVG